MIWPYNVSFPNCCGRIINFVGRNSAETGANLTKAGAESTNEAPKAKICCIKTNKWCLRDRGIGCLGHSRGFDCRDPGNTFGETLFISSYQDTLIFKLKPLIEDVNFIA